jgi:feruloyl-CoA synthase
MTRTTESLFARPEVRVERRQDGSLILTSPEKLRPFPTRLGEYLLQWARSAPDRLFLAERSGTGPWRGVTYAAALEEVLRIASWLVARGLSADRPVAILSENSVEHGLLMLAALHVGLPALPVSSAYSLLSQDFAKLRAIVQRTSPGVIYVSDYGRYEAALAAIRGLHDATVIVGTDSPTIPAGALRFDELRAPTAASHASDASNARNAANASEAFANVGPDTVAKLLFTSGSTDEPKGVINTHRMLCSNQQAKAQVWPFLERQPPVIVDWLPWSHTFGGNHNFNLVLRNGGTLYIDAGRPTPALFPQTVANLREIAPTVYFNVPRGYELLVEALRADAVLRESFFSRLQVTFYAAASLPPHLWDALMQLAVSATGRSVPLVSAWGSTETAPLATDCHYQAERAGVIGLPVPGCELKLLRAGQKLEVRVRGPNVCPGYWRRPDLTAKHFDEEGFYLIGDAVRFVDDTRPELGLVFDGRVAEDFKLTSGTWVSVGTLRVQGIAALAPVAQDIVVAGADRAEVGFLIFPNLAACRSLCPDLAPQAAGEEIFAHREVRAAVERGLRELKRQSPGSSTHAPRALLLREPPSIDAGEITDKGYINQRAVLARRASEVHKLYTPGHPEVIRLE